MVYYSSNTLPRVVQFSGLTIFKLNTKHGIITEKKTISTKNKSLAHRLSVWIRMNLFIPDVRVGWYFPAVKKGLELLKNEKIDTIVSIGPPHTTHLIGKKLSVKYKLPHITVFIDPWIDISYYRNFKRSKLTLRIDKRMERSVLKNATAVVFVTETMRKDYESKYSFVKGKSKVLYWGYSEEDFKGIERGKKSNEEKTIIHAGNIFSYQNPVKFWEQINKEIDSGNKLKLKFIGSVDPAIKDSINEAGLTEPGGVLVRMVLSEYMACEVVWENQESQIV